MSQFATREVYEFAMFFFFGASQCPPPPLFFSQPRAESSVESGGRGGGGGGGIQPLPVPAHHLLPLTGDLVPWKVEARKQKGAVLGRKGGGC